MVVCGLWFVVPSGYVVSFRDLSSIFFRIDQHSQPFWDHYLFGTERLLFFDQRVAQIYPLKHSAFRPEVLFFHEVEVFFFPSGGKSDDLQVGSNWWSIFTSFLPGARKIPSFPSRSKGIF